MHILGDDGRLLATSFAVVMGLTYNFLPFMVLPLYASLEKIDPPADRGVGRPLRLAYPRLLQGDAARCPSPGVVAGTLLTFIPAAGDYINAELLGQPQDRMVGNVIQTCSPTPATIRRPARCRWC